MLHLSTYYTCAPEQLLNLCACSDCTYSRQSDCSDCISQMEKRILQNIFIFVIEMKGWIKYIFLFIVAIALFEVSDEKTIHIQEIEKSETSSYLSDSESTPCLPRQTVGKNQSCSQSTCRRPANSIRHNLKFVKSGKTLNQNIICIVQKTSSNTFSSLTDATTYLVKFGRRII